MKYLLILILAYHASASAMQYEASKVASASGHEINVMRMNGVIENREGLHWMFEIQKLDPSLDTLFVLSSPGGNVPMGFSLINKVEDFLRVQAQANRKTWIVLEGDCSSMCVPLFYTWRDRFAVGGARIGLHGVSLGGIAYDSTETDIYFHNISDRAQARGDLETIGFMNQSRAKGEFSSAALTAHSAADLASQGAGLIPELGLVSSESALIELINKN